MRWDFGSERCISLFPTGRYLLLAQRFIPTIEKNTPPCAANSKAEFVFLLCDLETKKKFILRSSISMVLPWLRAYGLVFTMASLVGCVLIVWAWIVDDSPQLFHIKTPVLVSNGIFWPHSFGIYWDP